VREREESFHLKNVLQFSIAYIFLRAYNSNSSTKTYVILIRVKLNSFLRETQSFNETVHNLLFIEKEKVKGTDLNFAKSLNKV
jgi:hypothetical protein